MALTEQRKIELAYDVLQSLSDRSITIEDRIAVLEIAIKSLIAKNRQYERRLK
jgi:hypothetical protein